MCERADDRRHDRSEERVVAGGSDEGEVVREESGVERGLDAGGVEAAVFGEWVVAVDEERAERERERARCRGSVARWWSLRRVVMGWWSYGIRGTF